jgi:hypothetical protein
VGVGCGHEFFFTNSGYQRQQRLTQRSQPWLPDPKEAKAESSCFATRHLHHPVLENAKIVHLTRDPMKIIRTQRRNHYDLDYACEWWIDVNQMIEKWEDSGRYCRVRVEDCPNALLKIVGKEDAQDYWKPKTPGEYNSKWATYKERCDEELTWENLPDTVSSRRLRKMAVRYGYLEGK